MAIRVPAALILLALIAVPVASAQTIGVGSLVRVDLHRVLPIPLPDAAPQTGIDPDAPLPPAVEAVVDAPPSDPQPQPQPEPQPSSDSHSAPLLPLADEQLRLLRAPLGPVQILRGADLGLLTSVGPLLPGAAPDAAPAAAPLAPPPAPVATSSAAAPVAAPALASAALVAAAVTAGAAATPAAPFAWDRLKRLAFLAALYTRIAKERLLDHGSRDRLLTVIRERPGLPVTDLADAAGVPRNTATYHLRRLEREGLAVSQRSGRVRVWFVPGGVARKDEAPAFAALRHDTTRAIAMEVAASPGLDQQALCARFGLAPSLAHWHADRLVQSGLVRKERDGRRVRYYPTEGLPRVATLTG